MRNANAVPPYNTNVAGKLVRNSAHRRRCAERDPQPGLTVRRLHVVHVRQITKRHDPAQEVVFPNHDLLGRLPPDDPGSDAAKFRTHALSLPQASNAAPTPA